MRIKTALTHSTALCCLIVFLSWCSSEIAVASPWAEKEGYGAKTGGKLVFGLKHTLFSWMNPWAEAHDTIYETPWTGFCAGIGKSVIYTAAGAIQLVTFPIPVDFPNVGLGMHIPANHLGVNAKTKKAAGNPPSAAELSNTEPVTDAVASTTHKEPSSDPIAAEVQKTVAAIAEKAPATKSIQNTSAQKNLDKVIK